MNRVQYLIIILAITLSGVGLVYSNSTILKLKILKESN